MDRADGGTHPVPNCPKLHGIRQDQIRQWLLDRETYEEDLRAACTRRNLEVRNYMQGWKECFYDKRVLKQFMIMRKLAGEPKDLDEATLEAELRKIVEEPKNGVEADIPFLFNGIHMDMKDDEVMSRVCKFLADCDERLESRVMKGHLKKPEMRKKIFKRLLDNVDPEAVRDACMLDMDKMWHATDFDWARISELILHHAQEQQRFFDTYGAGRKKPVREPREVKPKSKELRKDDHSRHSDHDKRPKHDERDRSRGRSEDRRDRSRERRDYSRDRGYDRDRDRGYNRDRERQRSYSRDRGRPYERRDDRGGRHGGKPGAPPGNQVKFGLRGRSPGPPHGSILRNAGWPEFEKKNSERSNSKDKKQNWSRESSAEKAKAGEQSVAQPYFPYIAGEDDEEKEEPMKVQTQSRDNAGFEFPLSNRAAAKRYHAGEKRKKDERKRKARELEATEDFLPLSWSSEDEVEETYWERRGGRSILRFREPRIAPTARRVYGWERDVIQRAPNTPMPPGCLRCGNLAHALDKCPGATSSERAKIRYEWKPVVDRMHSGNQTKHGKKNAKFAAEMKKAAEESRAKHEAWLKKQEEARPKKIRRTLQSSAGETVATINDVLDVPYCPDNGSDVCIISTAMVKELRARDDTVSEATLAKPWIGCAVGNLPITSTSTVDLRVKLHTAAGQVQLPGKHLFYVVDNNDELIVSKHALLSIGLDMNKLLEQVAVRQGQGDGDDIGNPDEEEDIAFGVQSRSVRDTATQLDAEDMRADTKLAAWMKTCLLCPHTRGGRVIQRPQQYAWHATQRNEGLHFDFLFMGESWRGPKYVLVLKDDLTHYCRLIACDSPTSQVAVDAIMEWSALFGVPEVWISDGGSHFKNSVMKELSTRLKVQHNIVLAYCPWRNGTVERVNRDILGLMRIMLRETKLKETEWDYLLPLIQANINQTPVATLDHASPMECFTGLEPTTALTTIVGKVNAKLHKTGFKTIDWDRNDMRSAIEDLRRSLQEIHSSIVDRRREAENKRMREKANQNEFEVTEGDFVLWSRVDENTHYPKLLVTWIGPFRVIECLPYSCVIEHLITGAQKEAHHSRLKFYAESHFAITEEILDHISEQGTTLAVGQIEDARLNPDSNQWELLIHWRGLESHEASWEQLPAMYREIPSLVQTFADQLPNGAKRVGLVEALAQL